MPTCELRPSGAKHTRGISKQCSVWARAQVWNSWHPGSQACPFRSLALAKANTKNVQETRLKTQTQWLSKLLLSNTALFLYDYYLAMRRILLSPHRLPSPLLWCILNQAVLCSSAANLHISGFALSEDNFSCLMRSENEVRHELEKGHSMCSEVY